MTAPQEGDEPVHADQPHHQPDGPESAGAEHDGPSQADHDGPSRTGGGAGTAAVGEGADEAEDQATGPAEPGESHHALAVPRGMTPPRPPRRTGVFVDPDDLREHVGGLLRAILGGYEVDAFGNFTFTHEGARIFVTVGMSPMGPHVGVFSVTNLEVDLTPQLAAFLVTTNHTLGFGSFSYDVGNRSVWLRHTLLGTTLDGPELQSAVAAVATTAARVDGHIRDEFGGRTFQEAPNDVQRKMEPPEPSESGPAAPNASGYL